jgi:hypothetical protein
MSRAATSRRRVRRVTPVLNPNNHFFAPSSNASRKVGIDSLPRVTVVIVPPLHVPVSTVLRSVAIVTRVPLTGCGFTPAHIES